MGWPNSGKKWQESRKRNQSLISTSSKSGEFSVGERRQVAENGRPRPYLRNSRESEKPELAISRVLSRTIIHLGRPSPAASSNLPGSPLGTGGVAVKPRTPLFGLAPGGVYRAANCYQSRGALLPHHFTLTNRGWRYIFCGTFHRLTPPRRYLAPCPKEPGLSSASMKQRLSGQLRPFRTANSKAFPVAVRPELRKIDNLVVNSDNDNSIVNFHGPNHASTLAAL